MERNTTLHVNDEDIYLEVAERKERSTKEREFYNLQDEIPAKYRYCSIFLHTKLLYDYAKLVWGRTNEVSIAGYAGQHGTRTMLFDFDIKDKEQKERNDISLPYADAVKFVISLQQRYELSDEQIKVYFSGKKGFHVVIPIIIFGHDYHQFDYNIHLRCKAVCMAMAPKNEFDTIDDSLYILTGIIRRPNTQREDGELFKIPLTVQELRTRTLDEIRELARAPRDEGALFDDDTFFGSDPIPALVEIWNSTRRVNAKSVTTYETKSKELTQPTNGDTSKLSLEDNTPAGSAKVSVGGYPEWYKALHSDIEEGTRNTKLSALVRHFIRMGHEYEEVLALTRLVNKNRCNPPLGDKEVVNMCRGAHRRHEMRQIISSHEDRLASKKPTQVTLTPSIPVPGTPTPTVESEEFDSVYDPADVFVHEVSDKTKEEAEKEIKERKLNDLKSKFYIPTPDNQPPKTMDCITFNDVSFAKPGYLSAIKGHLKIGKSNIASAIMAAAINTSNLSDTDKKRLSPELLGFRVNHSLIQRMLYLDCEQDAEDLWWSYHGVYRRWGFKEIQDAQKFGLDFSNIEYNGTRGKTVEERKNYLELMCERGETNAVIVDSGRGLMYDFNNVDDSMRLLEFLEGLAVHHKVAIICTIHKNLGKQKDGSPAKSVGHFGSMLEQQAYCVLDIEKHKENSQIKIDEEPDNRRQLYVQYARRGASGPSTAVWFDWDEDRWLFTRCESPTEESEGSKKDKEYDVKRFIRSLEQEAACMGSLLTLKTTELRERLSKYLNISEESAKTYMKQKFKVVFDDHKTGYGVYEFHALPRLSEEIDGLDSDEVV